MKIDLEIYSENYINIHVGQRCLYSEKSNFWAFFYSDYSNNVYVVKIYNSI